MPDAYNHEKITVANTAIGFTASLLTLSPGAIPERAVCIVETAEIRFRVDGVDPTTAVGLLRSPGQEMVITGLHDIENFRAIRTGSASGVIQVTLER